MDPVRVPVLSGRHHRRRYPAQPGHPVWATQTLLHRTFATRGDHPDNAAGMAEPTVMNPGIARRPLNRRAAS